MFENLTPREREVLSFMVKGMGNNEIANALTIALLPRKRMSAAFLPSWVLQVEWK